MIPPEKREEWIIRQARERPGAERAAFLDGACAGDLALRERLGRLLPAHDRPEEVLAGGVDAATVKATLKLDFANAPDEAVGQKLGRYRLLERVGEGGCGVVYVAEQTEPVRRRVALKVIKLGMDTKQVVARFEAERQALAMMDHPNIAKVLDAGVTDAGRPYFIMELVRGIKITDYCDQERVGTRGRLELFIQICKAIQHAHQKGIIHRDIKPSNILVTLHDGVPVPKVIDFGIAKATEGRLTDATVYTQLHQFIGTPAYMSPEQAEMSGLDIDTRSDIYSLGVLLYELLTGTTPFDPRELMESGLDAMRKTIREKEPVKPSTKLHTLQGEDLTTTAKRHGVEASRLVSQLRGDLDWIVMKCLEKDRQRRYDTANGLAMDLKRHLSHEPVVARPPSAGYRVRKAWQRNKLIFTSAAMVAIALVIGGTVSIWQERVAQRARRAAEIAGQQAISSAQVAEEQRAKAEEHFREAEEAKHLAQQREEEMLRRAYSSDLNLAHQAVKNNNLGRALELLERYSPPLGGTDLRGWEWRYLWALCRSDAEFELCRVEDSVLSTALSPDGQWVALGGYTKTGVRIWNLPERREVATLADGEEFCHASFSPDGRALAFGSKAFLRIWDCTSRQTVAEARLDQPLVSVGFSSDGQRLVTFTQSDAIMIWDAKDLQKTKVHKVPSGLAHLGSPFAFSPDLKTAVRVEGFDNIVAVDLETGEERWRLKSNKGWSSAMAISPDGRLLVTSFALKDASIRVLQMSTGKELAVLPGHGAWISALVFWPDGMKLAAASADQTISVWDLQTFQRLRVLRGHETEIWSLALARDGRSLVSGGKDGLVLVWDPNKDPAERNHWRLPGRYRAWTFSPAPGGMVTIEDETCNVVKLTGPRFSNREVLSEIGRGDPAFSAASSCLFSLSAKHLAVLSTNGVLSVWDLEGRRRVGVFPTAIEQGYAVAFAPDESRVWLAKDLDSGVEFSEWDLQRRTLLRSVPAVRSPFVLAPDKWVFGPSGSNAGMFHDLSSGKTTRPVMFPGRLSPLRTGLSSSPDGSLLVVSHDVGLLTVWKTADLISNPAPEPIQALGGILLSFNSSGFSSDGSRLFGCSPGPETIKIWDTVSYHDLLTLMVEDATPRGARLSPDGHYLAAWDGGRVFLWQAASWDEIQQAENLEKNRLATP